VIATVVGNKNRAGSYHPNLFARRVTINIPKSTAYTAILCGPCLASVPAYKDGPAATDCETILTIARKRDGK
jgi:hypothetical protein